MAGAPAEAALALVVKDGEVRFEVHAKPRAKKSAIVGVRSPGGALEVAIAAPPVRGRETRRTTSGRSSTTRH